MINRTAGTFSYSRIFVFLVFVVATGIIGWLISTEGCSDPTVNSVDAGGGKAKQVDAITVDANDLEFDLNGLNTDIKWTGSNSIGLKPTGFFFELSGKAILESKNRKLKHFEVTIDMNGVKAMADSLTKKLKHKGFFEVDKFPQAKFVSTSVHHQARPGDPDGTNCVVEGNFQLRDVTQSITIPMEVSKEGTAMKLVSEFKINRKDYGVVYSDATGDMLIRDEVLIGISVDSTSVEATKPVAVVEAPPWVTMCVGRRLNRMLSCALAPTVW